MADHRTFAEAAAACFVSQPTLSMQLQKLEAELGVQIFDRTAQPVRATLVGAKILAQARTALVEARRVQELAAEDAGEVSGELRLAAIPTLAPYLLPLFLPALVERYPNLSVTAEELQTQQIIYRLKADTLDVGLLATPLHNSQVVELRLFYEPFLIYASPRHPLANAKRVRESDLAAQDAWLLNDGHCFRDQSIRLCGERRKTGPKGTNNLRFESGNLETLKKLVDRGPGFTFLPWLSAADLLSESASFPHRRQLKEFEAPAPTREISLVHGQFYRRSAVLEAIKVEILACLPKTLRAIKRGDSRQVAMPTFD